MKIHMEHFYFKRFKGRLVNIELEKTLYIIEKPGSIFALCEEPVNNKPVSELPPIFITRSRISNPPIQW